MSNLLPIGLDIGSLTIKSVELEKRENKLWLRTVGSISTPPKGLSSDNKNDLEAVSVAIKKLITESKTTNRKVNVSLPESQIITRVIEMPFLTERELVSAIKWEAEQYIPMPLDEVKMDFSILSSPKNPQGGKMQVLLVAAPLTLIDKYKNVLNMAGLDVVALEPEIISVSRSMIGAELEPILLINFGGSTTEILIFKSNILILTRSIPSGGQALTRSIVNEMGLGEPQAEEYKRTYGLEEDKLEGKLLIAVGPVLENVTAEIKKSLAFYQNRYPTEPIKVIKLCGGAAFLPGILPYFTGKLGIETQIGNPWNKINATPQIIEQGPFYAVACGLAMREPVW